jgi:hypothetical protein
MDLKGQRRRRERQMIGYINLSMPYLLAKKGLALKSPKLFVSTHHSNCAKPCIRYMLGQKCPTRKLSEQAYYTRDHMVPWPCLDLVHYPWLKAIYHRSCIDHRYSRSRSCSLPDGIATRATTTRERAALQFHSGVTTLQPPLHLLSKKLQFRTLETNL